MERICQRDGILFLFSSTLRLTLVSAILYSPKPKLYVIEKALDDLTAGSNISFR